MRRSTTALPVSVGLVIVLSCLSVQGPFAAGVGGGTAPQEASVMTPTVLFLCPHGAGKSVLASAQFQRLARERGLAVRVESAGTDPDPAVSAAVATHLRQNGYDLPVGTPQKVTAAQVASADVVISLGCDLSGLPQPRGTLQRWDEVPGPGEDVKGADEAIRRRVIALVEELLARQRK
jgi:protein-tyrosine-phosphatase